MQHVMVDLETMGLRPDAAIVSIGACHFDAETVFSKFESPVNLGSCVECGLTTDPSTVDWWAKQPAASRAFWQTVDAPRLDTALADFNAWLRSLGSAEQLCVWGNGANFDEPILSSAYRALQADPPWKFYNVRCFRTVRSLFQVSDMPRTGTHHRSVDDAVHQAVHLQRVCAVHGVKLP